MAVKQQIAPEILAITKQYDDYIANINAEIANPLTDSWRIPELKKNIIIAEKEKKADIATTQRKIDSSLAVQAQKDQQQNFAKGQNRSIVQAVILGTPISNYSREGLLKAYNAIPIEERNQLVNEAKGMLSQPFDEAVARANTTLPQSEQTLIKALNEGETLGGTRQVITSPESNVTYFVDATQQGPKISAATDQVRSIETATNITPIVEYKTVPDQVPITGQATGLQAKLLTNTGGDPNNVVTGYSAIPFADSINSLLENQAKNFQQSITSQLLGQIFDKTATQTEKPVYSFNETGLTSTNPVTPPEYPSDGLEKLKESSTKFISAEEVAAEKQKLEDTKNNQAILDAQAKTNAELETKRLADAKAAELSRLRGSQKFEYDAAIESALKAAEGNSSLARRQLSASDARQKVMDAESLNKTNERKGNPTTYAGGFAEKAIQKTMQTPADFKIPSFAKPRSAPIVPTANELAPSNAITPSSLLPKLDGLQFGGN
jgi:hypothetical protein